MFIVKFKLCPPTIDWLVAAIFAFTFLIIIEAHILAVVIIHLLRNYIP